MTKSRGPTCGDLVRRIFSFAFPLAVFGFALPVSAMAEDCTYSTWVKSSKPLCTGQSIIDKDKAARLQKGPLSDCERDCDNRFDKDLAYCNKRELRKLLALLSEEK